MTLYGFLYTTNSGHDWEAHNTEADNLELACNQILEFITEKGDYSICQVDYEVGVGDGYLDLYAEIDNEHPLIKFYV